MFARRKLFVLLALSATLVGCGASDPSVNGRVSFDGSPVEKGSVAFSPVGGNGSPAGALIRNGEFEIEKVAVGRYLVTFTAKQMPEQPPTGNQSIRAIELIPPNAVGNGQEVEVVPGAQTLDFELTSP